MHAHLEGDVAAPRFDRWGFGKRLGRKEEEQMHLFTLSSEKKLNNIPGGLVFNATADARVLNHSNSRPNSSRLHVLFADHDVDTSFTFRAHILD